MTPRIETIASTPPSVPATESTRSRTSSVRALGAVLGDDRHERLRERAFGEQSAQQVRDLVRENEDLEHDRGNDRGEHHVPRQPGDPGQQRGDSDDGGAAEEAAAHAAERRAGHHGKHVMGAQPMVADGRSGQQYRTDGCEHPDLWLRPCLQPPRIGRIRASFLESPRPWPISSPPRSEPVRPSSAVRATWRPDRSCAPPSRVSSTPSDAGNKEEAAAKLKAAGPIIDAAVNKGVIHRNKASRHKSHLNARVKEMSAG